MHIGIMSQGAIASILAWRLQKLDLPYCVLSKRPLHPVQIETLEGEADMVLPLVVTARYRMCCWYR
ncbi:hypothetical protein ACFQMB_11340 [Pseudobowmanella zhangzhouensis]|uniref:hypothetical protein n=1 Tax=Pseudobowmanella zhangzhouensis TaxID=1537679 RepID=UPI0036174114